MLDRPQRRILFRQLREPSLEGGALKGMRVRHSDGRRCGLLRRVGRRGVRLDRQRKCGRCARFSPERRASRGSDADLFNLPL
jgi:hypothetical protein